MATEEVGIRLSLQGRREAAKGLADTRGELEQVADAGQDVDKAGRAAAKGLEKATDKRFAVGFARIRKGAVGVAGVLGRGIVRGAKVAGVALGATALAMGATSVKAIGLAGDAAETASAFNTVFGPAADNVQGKLDRLTNRFGLYNPELQDATRQFGVFAKAAGVADKQVGGFSTKLVKAGLDLGSFYNADPGQVFQALQSGLSGEAEPLRKFGIFLSDAAVKAEAAAQGLTGELTDQQKVMLRQQIILKSLGDAQGDLARTSQGFANQQRAAAGRSQTLLRMLGGPLTTAATGAFRGLNSILGVAVDQLRDRLPGLEGTAQRLSGRFARLGRTWAQDLPGAIDTLVAKGAAIKDFFSWFSSGSTGADMNNIKVGLAGIGSAVGSVDWVAVKDGLGEGVSDTVSVFGTVIGFAADHVDTLAQYLPGLVVAFAAYKTAQAASNVAALGALPIQAAHAVALLASARANSRLATQMGLTTGATKKQTAVSKISTLATKAWALAQKGLNLVLSNNPIGWIIRIGLLLVGAFVLAYKKSDKFRGIVDNLWAALKTAGRWVLDLGKKVGVWVIDKMLAAKDKVIAVKDAIGKFIDKIRDGIRWVKDLGGKLENLPGVGLARKVLDGAFANGGYARAGGTYLVGERGPEIFTPGVSGMVHPVSVSPAAIDMPPARDAEDDLRDFPTSLGRQELHLYIDGREVLATVRRRWSNEAAFA